MEKADGLGDLIGARLIMAEELPATEKVNLDQGSEGKNYLLYKENKGFSMPFGGSTMFSFR